MDEQLFWASTLEKLELATKPLPAQNADAKQLASRIITILSNDTYLKNAEKAGASIRERQGVDNAVDLIEKKLNLSLPNPKAMPNIRSDQENLMIY